MHILLPHEPLRMLVPLLYGMCQCVRVVHLVSQVAVYVPRTLTKTDYSGVCVYNLFVAVYVPRTLTKTDYSGVCVYNLFPPNNWKSIVQKIGNLMILFQLMNGGCEMVPVALWTEANYTSDATCTACTWNHSLLDYLINAQELASGKFATFNSPLALNNRVIQPAETSTTSNSEAKISIDGYAVIQGVLQNQAKDFVTAKYRRLRWDLVLSYALFEQGLANRFFTVDPANTRRGHAVARQTAQISNPHTGPDLGLCVALCNVRSILRKHSGLQQWLIYGKSDLLGIIKKWLQEGAADKELNRPSHNSFRVHINVNRVQFEGKSSLLASDNENKGQPGSIPALLLPLGNMAARHRKGFTDARLLFIIFMNWVLPGRQNLNRRTIKVLSRSLWLKSQTTRWRNLEGSISASFLKERFDTFVPNFNLEDQETVSIRLLNIDQPCMGNCECRADIRCQCSLIGQGGTRTATPR
ncbi:hypothetical protein CLF_106304 [Clonorchis sinensis]|uniref:Uncharacterized protein n=1 Tax=Clonorchis sinensis TaxID=79923 RepID=G7YPV5_CLOSI|nr:hypothetical protein CLF_106304 [Clonorchis sinensis]